MALASSKLGVFDLDVLGAWAVLSTGAIAYMAMIHWSDTLRRSHARIIMVCWGILVGISLLFGRVILYDTPLNEGERACYSTTMPRKLLQYPAQLQYSSETFNCTYKCFSALKPMRSPSEIMAVPRSMLDNNYSYLNVILLGPVLFAAYTAISWDTREHTPSQLYTRLVMRWLIPERDPSSKEQRDRMTQAIYNASAETWYGGYVVLFTYVHRLRWGKRKATLSFLLMPWMGLELAMDILCVPLLIGNIVLCELNILGSHLPVNENMHSIGQWGQIVNTVLIMFAAFMLKGIEMYKEWKRISAENVEIPRENLHQVELDERRRHSEKTVIDTHVGDVEGQTSGVTIRSLRHAETLQDMEDMIRSSMRKK